LNAIDLRRAITRRAAAKATVSPLIDTIADFGTAIGDAVAKDYNIANSRAEKFLQGYMQTRVDMINATTREAVQKALTADDPQAAVRRVFEVAKTSRAKLIADTEVVRASNWAAVDAGKWVGELDFKRWVTQEDSHVRHAHHEMQDQVVAWNDPFEAPNGSHAQWPGGFREPALSVNCRCAAIPARAKHTRTPSRSTTTSERPTSRP
jgi:uncharacterized protein with gpF-like domain